MALVINTIALIVVIILIVVANRTLSSERKKTAVVVFGLQEAIRAASDAIEKLEEDLKQARSYASSLLEDKLELSEENEELSEKNEELKEQLKEKDERIVLQGATIELQHKAIMILLKERRAARAGAPEDKQNDISEADKPVDADTVAPAPDTSASEEKD